MHDMFAPVEQQGEHLSFTAEEVAVLQTGIKKGLDAFLAKQPTNTEVTSEVPDVAPIFSLVMTLQPSILASTTSLQNVSSVFGKNTKFLF